jgi:aminopeptidase
MIDADAFAALIADWCLDAQPGQQILISTTTLAEEPAVALHRVLLERGAWPFLRLSPGELEADFYRHAREEQLDTFPSLELLEAQTIDASVRIQAPANTRSLAAVDPALPRRVAKARDPVREARLARRWCGTIWPTPALAQEAGMSEREYTDFLEGALFLDRADPVAAWQELSRRQASVIERLATGRQIRIEADGTDLLLDVTGRTWINSDGRRNMPSGEVFTGPIESSANGTIRFDVPSGADRGTEVRGVELTFAAGEVVEAHADHGERYLRAALAGDPGARFLGELGIGTNEGIDRATGSTLLDEKIAGTIHLALGRSYPETGGTNVSALHWDLICDLRQGGRVTVDNEVLIKDGALVL